MLMLASPLPVLLSVSGFTRLIHAYLESPLQRTLPEHTTALHRKSFILKHLFEIV